MIVLEVVEGVDKKILQDAMKDLVEDILEEASKVGQINIWLKDIEEGGPVIRNRRQSQSSKEFEDLRLRFEMKDTSKDQPHSRTFKDILSEKDGGPPSARVRQRMMQITRRNKLLI